MKRRTKKHRGTFRSIILSVILRKLNGSPFNMMNTVIYLLSYKSTEEQIDTFYVRLENVSSDCNSQNAFIIMVT